ncbi:MAG: four helix bundle protein [Lewinellaceae bacterium]|jgi:hypothetical protein|nr:four helix bundle protein [Lewinellaceae bacterium]
MKIYFFEKLDVWQRGRVLVKSIYQLSGNLPMEEALLQQRPRIEEIGNKINALRESQLKRDK